MDVKEGTLLEITHVRKGVFIAVALRDFDTEGELSYPVALAEGYVVGAAYEWWPGDVIPCRAEFVQRMVKVEVVQSEDS